MGIRRVQELAAFRSAQATKRLIYALVRSRPEALSDRSYVSQIFGAASSVEANIAEGFHRFGAGEFRQFLRYALGSLAEAERWIQDGIDRGYFSPAECQEALESARRCRGTAIRLFNSLEPFVRNSRKTTSGPNSGRSRS